MTRMKHGLARIGQEDENRVSEEERIRLPFFSCFGFIRADPSRSVSSVAFRLSTLLSCARSFLPNSLIRFSHFLSLLPLAILTSWRPFLFSSGLAEGHTMRRIKGPAVFLAQFLRDQ